MFIGGANVSTCAFVDFRRCGQRGLGEQEGAADVDVHHQVEFLAESDSVGSVEMALALLTTMPTPPKCSTAVSMARATSLPCAHRPPRPRPCRRRPRLRPRRCARCRGAWGGVLRSWPAAPRCPAAGGGKCDRQTDSRLPPDTTSVRSVNDSCWLDMALLVERSVRYAPCVNRTQWYWHSHF